MSERLTELLVKAVRCLEGAEQDEVLEALLGGAGPAMPAPVRRSLSRWTQQTGWGGQGILGEQRFAAAVSETGDLKVLPVRLPVADYERLRAWARQHEFSMAVIVRTLVERFLDGQAAPGAGRAGTEPATQPATQPEPGDPAAGEGQVTEAP